MNALTKHVIITLVLFGLGLLYLTQFKSLLTGEFNATTIHRINLFGASLYFVVLLLYSRELLRGYQPKFKIVIGSVVLAYALIWMSIFLLAQNFTGLIMH